MSKEFETDEKRPEIFFSEETNPWMTEVETPELAYLQRTMNDEMGVKLDSLDGKRRFTEHENIEYVTDTRLVCQFQGQPVLIDIDEVEPHRHSIRFSARDEGAEVEFHRFLEEYEIPTEGPSIEPYYWKNVPDTAVKNFEEELEQFDYDGPEPVDGVGGITRVPVKKLHLGLDDDELYSQNGYFVTGDAVYRLDSIPDEDYDDEDFGAEVEVKYKSSNQSFNVGVHPDNEESLMPLMDRFSPILDSFD